MYEFEKYTSFDSFCRCIHLPPRPLAAAPLPPVAVATSVLLAAELRGGSFFLQKDPTANSFCGKAPLFPYFFIVND
jgi:hypothetical protein